MSVSSSRHARTFSPPLSTTSYSQAISAGQQRLNIVTRLAIEGRVKKGEDGASMKLYLKISLPLDSITPGGTIALFPEENLKILDSQVHPLDHNSVPYSFSPTISPLLGKAAGALNLPPRSSQSYISTDTFASSTSIPPLDDKYTGHILVSGYHVSYVLPKEFPRRDVERSSRRGSISMHFMAGIDMWVPFLSKPPYAPFHLSIPVPRCLSNHIRLKIYSPKNSTAMSSSMASLSSADGDPRPWEVTSDPPVTRSTTRLSRANSYTHFADDESSDASTSTTLADGCGVHGTFPSTDRIRVRWAEPAIANKLPATADGRRRVGVREVKSDITCSVLGKKKGKSRLGSTDSLLVRFDYTATCKGVWSPGVATFLGLDVGLHAGEDCDASWAPGAEPKWTVTGGSGFTGFAVGKPQRERTAASSPEGIPKLRLPSSPDAKKGIVSGIPLPSTRPTSTSSPASLLHAPLPAENVSDFSFDESSPASTPTGTLSSMASFTQPSSPERERRSRSQSRSRASSINGLYPHTDTDVEDDEIHPPKVPITVHVNMIELQPPPKNTFTFSISGVLMVTPIKQRHTSPSRTPHQSTLLSDSELDFDPILLPTFRVLHSDKESITTIIRSEIDGAMLDVFGDSGDMQTRKATLQKGGHIKCGSDGARVATRPISASVIPSGFGSWNDESSDNSAYRSRSLYRTPHRASPQMTSMSVLRTPLSASRIPLQRDGPLMIPFVTVDVTPLWTPDAASLDSYAVHISLPAPSNTDTDWLEFGLAFPHEGSYESGDPASIAPPRVSVASASVEGISVRFETNLSSKQETGLSKLSMSFEEMKGKDWITWVRVHVGNFGGGKVDVVYLVSEIHGVTTSNEKVAKRKHMASNAVPLDVLLPSFPLSVGRLEVSLQLQAGYELLNMRSNLAHQQVIPEGRKLLHYSMEEFFYPRVSINVAPASKPTNILSLSRLCWRTSQVLAFTLPSILVIFLLVNLQLVTTELHEVKQAMRAKELAADAPETNMPETVTVTSTVLVEPSPRWWFSPETDTTSDSTTLSITPKTSDLTYATSSLSLAETPSAPLPSFTSHPSSSSSPASNNGFLKDIVHAWSRRFKEPPVRPKMRETMDSMLDGMHTVWQFFRKVMHYPLPPP